MAIRLKGKSAVVTGGGGGIGGATCLALAEEGAKVVVNDISKNPDGGNSADNIVEEIRKAGGIAVANYDSVTEMASGRSIIDTAVKNFGRIDILVNCAGNYSPMQTVDMPESHWDSIMSVHLKGHFSCTQAALKQMLPQKYGRIINISSRAAFNYYPGGDRSVAYAAAKAGVLGFTARLSAELKDTGITVNAVLPGAVTSLFPDKKMPAYFWGGDKREGPDFVAPTIVFFATDEAKNITGQIIHATGGQLCIYNRPLQIPGPHTLINKEGKWSVDELSKIIPRFIGLS
jgi:NAD(P)-dependent dehydrogenase (short-subunit alcohol dehydrogenase family)